MIDPPLGRINLDTAATGRRVLFHPDTAGERLSSLAKVFPADRP